jgi:phosphodiesterase/alkaline phosphatase D-like protein
MLGREQLAWFLSELSEASRHYPVIVWVTSVPWIADAEEGADHWGGYAAEREQIAAAIADLEIGGLIVLAGDAHMVAIDDGSSHDYAPNGGASFPVMQAAALDRYGSIKGGPYSEGTYPGGGRFGLLEVEDRGDVIRIDLTGLTWENEELASLEISVPVEAP